jgi:hypothetical protein
MRPLRGFTQKAPVMASGIVSRPPAERRRIVSETDRGDGAKISAAHFAKQAGLAVRSKRVRSRKPG